MVSLAEAAAIEAHNEAIRDAVIQRECPGAADAHCGPRVHAAAVATLSAADADAQETLAAVRTLVVARRPRRVVLVTSAIPFKSEPSELKKLIAAVRDGRCELIVVRLPAATPPRGVLSDGVAKIEQRLTLVPARWLFQNRRTWKVPPTCLAAHSIPIRRRTRGNEGRGRAGHRRNRVPEAPTPSPSSTRT